MRVAGLYLLAGELITAENLTTTISTFRGSEGSRPGGSNLTPLHGSWGTFLPLGYWYGQLDLLFSVADNYCLKSC